MEIIKAYKTEDGKIHSSKLEATKHEFTLAMRGLIQTELSGTIRADVVPLNVIVSVLVRKSNLVRDTINRFNVKIKCIEATQESAIAD